MTKEALVKKIEKTLNRLPVDKVGELSKIADSMLKTLEEYTLLKESEINIMSLAYAENSFKSGWDLEDKEENEYWDSFK